VRKVRGSEVNDFLRCRTKWNYAWNERLKPKTPNNKLFFGTMFHKYLESFYKNFSQAQALNDMLKLFDETDTSGMEQFEIDELYGLAFNVAENYFAQWKSEDSKFEVLATELEFSFPITTKGLWYTGTIDLVVKDEHGQVWFYDHKTTSSIEMYEKKADMDRQISRYWWALQQLGYDVAGFVYNIILKEVPKKPELLKKGGLSQNKAQKTTYDLYLQAIQENGLDVNDYREMLDHLKAQGNRYFKRMKVTRLQPEIDASILELIEVAKDMDNARIYRNITKDCSWDCQHQSICQASMDGSNVDYLTEQLFTKENEQ
jgi:RecB family exonuclease